MKLFIMERKIKLMGAVTKIIVSNSNPGRDPMLILQDLARFLQKDVNLARSCKTMLILQDLAR